MHVAILTRYCHPYHRPGGLERMVYYHCRALEARGVRVTLYCEPPFPGAPVARVATAVRFVPTLRIPFRYRPGQVVPDRILNYPWFSYRLGRVVVREAERERFDLVQANGVAAFGYAWRRRCRRDLPPLVFNPPGFEEFDTPERLKRLAYSGFRALFRYAARNAALVAAPDDCLVETTLRATGVSPQRVFVLRNGVDLEECLRPLDLRRQAGLRESLGLDTGGPVFLSVGRISANKGLEVLASALAIARPRLPEGWRWVHVGHGTGRRALEAKVRSLGLGERVRFTGFVDDAVKHNLFAIADVFVHPTLYEGSSIATIEALAHGLPVIGTRAGGIPDKVIDGENGRLIPPGDPGALAEALLEMARLSPLERRRLGARSRRLCEEKFTWERIGDELVARYRTLLAKPPCGEDGAL